ncbi:MAG: ugp1, partial [Acidimicrobiaceae bacterium]|nr:ugp1 [Acidimicrobiaceae bacterium]
GSTLGTLTLSSTAGSGSMVVGSTVTGFSLIGGLITGVTGSTVTLANVATSSSGGVTINLATGTITLPSAGTDLVAGFARFVGPTTGFTTYIAGDVGGLNLSASGPSDSLGFGAATSGVTVNLTTATSGNVVVAGGTDVYTGMSSVAGSPGNDTFVLPATGLSGLSFSGGGGRDTLNFASGTSGITVNLSSSTINSVAGSSVSGAYTGTITGFSNVIGTPFADVFYASGGTNVIHGGGGNNTFYLEGGVAVIDGGGSSGNTVNLSSASGPVTLDLTDSSFQNSGDGMVLITPGTIQNVVGSSSFANTILGGSGSGTITACTSACTASAWLSAGTGNYTLDASQDSGTVTLVGGPGSNGQTTVLKGGSGATTFMPGAGAVQIQAQSGSTVTNTLSFAGAPAGVDVNIGAQATFTISTTEQNLITADGLTAVPFGNTLLAANSVTGGWGGTVSLSGTFTKVIGTSFNDLLMGGESSASLPSVVLDGGLGNDVLMATGFNVTLDSEGNAYLYTGADSTTANCSVGSTCTVDYFQTPLNSSNQGVQVTLGSSPTSPGVAKKLGDNGVLDVLAGVSTVIGSQSGTDTLTAAAANQTLVAGNGNAIASTLTASAAGHDTLIGGDLPVQFIASCRASATVTCGGHDTIKAGRNSGNNLIDAQIVDSSGNPVAANDTIIAGGQNDFILGDPSDALSNVSIGNGAVVLFNEPVFVDLNGNQTFEPANTRLPALPDGDT